MIWWPTYLGGQADRKKAPLYPDPPSRIRVPIFKAPTYYMYADDTPETEVSWTEETYDRERFVLGGEEFFVWVQSGMDRDMALHVLLSRVLESAMAGEAARE